MVLEAVLYFVLGFLSAGLLGLMISPTIWNRAVVLTKRRIESSVPLTLNEIQADKDQLRAEFAMSTRRLEISIEELKDKAASQVIEINRKRDELAELNENSEERLSVVKELEVQASELRARLQDREARIEQATKLQDTLMQELERTSHELENTKSQLATAPDNMSDKADVPSELRKMKRKLSEQNKALELEKSKKDEAESRLKQVQKQYASSVELLERRERDLNRLRGASGEESSTSAELTRQLIDEKSRSVELEAKIAKHALQTEALLNDASNENVQNALETVKQQLSEKSNELNKLRKERDQLSKEVSAFERAKGEDWASERRDNAILRERINDMAAQVAALTAALEGENSPINEILSSATKKTKSRSKKSSATHTSQEETPVSLADRIRALQEAGASGR